MRKKILKAEVGTNMPYLTGKSAQGVMSDPFIKPTVGNLSYPATGPSTTGTGGNSFMSLMGGSGSPSAMGQIGQAADMIGNMFPPATNDPTTNAINAGVSTVSDALMQVPGYGQVIGGAMKLSSAANKALAEYTDGASTINNAQTLGDKILSSDLFAMTAPGFINTVTKKTVAGSNKDIAKDIDMGYDATPDVEEADFGGFSRLFASKKVKKREDLVKKTDTENALKASVIAKAKKDTIAAQNYTQDVMKKNRQQILGGINTNILSAKRGTKLADLTKLKEEVIVSLKEGGKVNVIPDGALHARKNNMEGVVDGEITNKGIPVVSFEEGGKAEQHAEIEKEEIIFHKELTLKLEELLKKHNEGDENAMLEAGKLLTYEILENTEDNVGLLKK